MMRGWIWLGIGLVWLAAVFLWTFDFTAGQFGSFGIHIQATRLIPRGAVPYVAILVLCIVVFGWIIPVGMGIYRLAAKR